ncbi:hypothetical protein BABA_22833 [Neobacillus bataviensis LMG 21833]|uniref:Uncharacterized protein n=1 Tax=Neobacillus bataviensis LMG 21833 TaxID=1117379 RepID=K6D9K8_9BACI|nr:hypothetical protein [Neobacillus bataviensis]EKN64773.1 hypothetical protein BABA_22833 [Neobacillus bataviensis LMG 21833]
MKKYLTILLLFSVLFGFHSGPANAQSTSNFKIEIISPTKVAEYPGKELKVKVKITNTAEKEIKDVFTYITMANLSKNWTVNLEDYSADQPVTIGTMKPHEEKIVSLPIQLVYTADYYLYTTVVSKENHVITSSDAIPVEIIGNTKIVPLQVQIVSIVMPLLLLSLLLIAIRRKR